MTDLRCPECYAPCDGPSPPDTNGWRGGCWYCGVPTNGPHTLLLLHDRLVASAKAAVPDAPEAARA